MFKSSREWKWSQEENLDPKELSLSPSHMHELLKAVHRGVVLISPHEAWKNFHLHLSVVQMGSRSTFVLCTVTDLCFPCHTWHNRMKEVYTEGSLWKNDPADGWWRVRGSSGTTKCEQLAISNYMHVLYSSVECHHVGATPPFPRLYSPDRHCLMELLLWYLTSTSLNISIKLWIHHPRLCDSSPLLHVLSLPPLPPLPRPQDAWPVSP